MGSPLLSSSTTARQSSFSSSIGRSPVSSIREGRYKEEACEITPGEGGRQFNLNHSFTQGGRMPFILAYATSWPMCSFR